MATACTLGGESGGDWIEFSVFLEFASSRGYRLMRIWSDYRVFMNRGLQRIYMIQVLDKKVRKDDLDDFTYFSK